MTDESSNQSSINQPSKQTRHKITRAYENPTERSTETDMSKTLWNGVRKGCSCGHTQSTTHPQDTNQPPPPAVPPTENTFLSGAPPEESDPDRSGNSEERRNNDKSNGERCQSTNRAQCKDSHYKTHPRFLPWNRNPCPQPLKRTTLPP